MGIVTSVFFIYIFLHGLNKYSNKKKTLMLIIVIKLTNWIHQAFALSFLDFQLLF